MDQIEQIVSGLMMPIIKEFNDAYYYGRHPEQSRKVSCDGVCANSILFHNYRRLELCLFYVTYDDYFVYVGHH